MEAIWPVVSRGFSVPLSPMPTVVANIQSGQRKSIFEFYAGASDSWMPNPQVELAYTYLVAQLVLHCYTLMTTPGIANPISPILQRLAECTQRHQYLFNVHKAVRLESSYIVCAHHLGISLAMYNKALRDSKSEDGYTLLSAEAFSWLISIRPGYLVYRLAGECKLSPICRANQPTSLVMISFLSAIQIEGWHSDAIFLMVPGLVLEFCCKC